MCLILMWLINSFMHIDHLKNIRVVVYCAFLIFFPEILCPPLGKIDSLHIATPPPELKYTVSP